MAEFNLYFPGGKKMQPPLPVSAASAVFSGVVLSVELSPAPPNADDVILRHCVAARTV
jgi:hypothetical protein